MKKKSVFFLVCILFLTTVNLYADTQKKNSWYIGFGLGSGIGFLNEEGNSNKSFTTVFNDFGDDIDSSYTHISPMLAFSMSFGLILTQRIHLGIEVSRFMQWAHYERIHYPTYTETQDSYFTIQNFYTVISYYPFEYGFFIKGGFGFNSLEIDYDTNIIDKSTLSYGYGFICGLGYDFRIYKSFNLGLHMDYTRFFYNENDIESYDMLYFHVAFNWF